MKINITLSFDYSQVPIQLSQATMVACCCEPTYSHTTTNPACSEDHTGEDRTQSGPPLSVMVTMTEGQLLKTACAYSV